MDQEPIAKKALIEAKETEVTQARNVSVIEMKKLDDLNQIRVLATTKALAARYIDQFRKRQKGAYPDTSLHNMPEAVFDRVVAAWDRDGTPLGPGLMDDPNLKGSAIYSYQGQKGFLTNQVLQACSVECAMALPECSTGKVERACTRGLVYRARFGAPEGPSGSANDFFVCRCNNGVMQFSSREAQTWTRDKGYGMKASVKSVVFKQQLFQKERVGEKEMACFGGFKSWIMKTYGNVTAELEQMAAKPKTAFAKDLQYKQIRKAWYNDCLGVKSPRDGKRGGIDPSAQLTALGSDSSMDIIYVKGHTTGAKVDVKKAQLAAKAAAQARTAAEIKAATAERTAAKKKEAAMLKKIYVGDNTQKKAGVESAKKDGTYGKTPNLQEAGLRKAEKAESAVTKQNVQLAVDAQADKKIAKEKAAIPAPKVPSVANATSCWKAQPGATFVYRAIDCTAANAKKEDEAAAQRANQWGQMIAGQRTPETEGAKLMSVVAPFGCLQKSKLGGNPDVYWGLHGAFNITLPCSPSGAKSYLSPDGAAKKAAVDLVREAEAKERAAYAKAFAAAGGKKAVAGKAAVVKREEAVEAVADEFA
jgi:hypothetical protein